MMKSKVLLVMAIVLLTASVVTAVAYLTYFQKFARHYEVIGELGMSKSQRCYQLLLAIEENGDSWLHDDCSASRYADESWLPLLMRSIATRKEPGCSNGHYDTILANIAGISPAEGATKEEFYAFWEAWWKQNQGKTRKDWAKTALLSAGISVEEPLSPSALRIALSKLGEMDPNDSFLKINVCRWIRDFGGLSGLLLGSEGRPLALSESEIKGLVDYEKWLAKYADDFGSLQSQPERSDWRDDPIRGWPVKKRYVIWTWWVVTVLGVILLCWYLWQKPPLGEISAREAKG